MTIEQKPSQESAPFSNREHVVYLDGSSAIDFQAEGTPIVWNHATFSKGLNSLNGTSMAIVTTHETTPDGSEGLKYWAMGRGVLLPLGEYDKDKGFPVDESAVLSAARLDQLAPEGLPDAIIGEPWRLTGDGVVTSVIFEGKTYASEPTTNVASPFLGGAGQMLDSAARLHFDPDKDGALGHPMRTPESNLE